jgi:hypothetical protein
VKQSHEVQVHLQAVAIVKNRLTRMKTILYSSASGSANICKSTGEQHQLGNSPLLFEQQSHNPCVAHSPKQQAQDKQYTGKSQYTCPHRAALCHDAVLSSCSRLQSKRLTCMSTTQMPPKGLVREQFRRLDQTVCLSGCSTSWAKRKVQNRLEHDSPALHSASSRSQRIHNVGASTWTTATTARHVLLTVYDSGD